MKNFIILISNDNPSLMVAYAKSSFIMLAYARPNFGQFQTHFIIMKRKTKHAITVMLTSNRNRIQLLLNRLIG